MEGEMDLADLHLFSHISWHQPGWHQSHQMSEQNRGSSDLELNRCKLVLSVSQLNTNLRLWLPFPYSRFAICHID